MDYGDKVCEEAMTWLSTPYVPRGYVKGVGADCGTLLHASYGTVFELAPMPTDYPVDWAAHSQRERYLEFIMPYVKECTKPKRGDFTLFHLAQAYSHAAIYLGDGNYIHAWGRKDAGCVLITPARVLYALTSADHPMKHFEPR